MAGNRIPIPQKPVASNELEVKSPAPVEAAKEEKQVILVTALRKGFYGGMRIKEGDQLTVESLDKVGSWMKIVDPKLRKQHEENLKAKKKEELAAGK